MQNQDRSDITVNSRWVKVRVGGVQHVKDEGAEVISQLCFRACCICPGNVDADDTGGVTRQCRRSSVADIDNASEWPTHETSIADTQ